MKKIAFFKIFILYCLVFFAKTSVAQQIPDWVFPDCGNAGNLPFSTVDDDSKPHGMLGKDCGKTTKYYQYADREVYFPDEKYTELKINLNFFFMQEKDGSANFDIDNQEDKQFLMEWVDLANQKLHNFKDYSQICPGPFTNNPYIKNIKLTLVPKFYTEIKDDQLAHIPSGYNSCSFNGTWFYEQKTNELHKDCTYKNGINVFFSDEKTVWTDYLAVQNDPNPILAYFGTDYWCAENPSLTDLTAPLSVTIRNFYTKYRKFKHPAGLNYNGDIIFWSTTREWLIGSGVTLAHEVLHCLGLSDQYYCANDIMNNGASSTSKQCFAMDMGECHLNLARSSARQFLDADQNYNVPREVRKDEKWDADLRIYQDVIVKTGATLTVTCKLLMAKDAKIIVERGARLIVDGATITNVNPCTDEAWGGIYVIGNSDKIQPNPYGTLKPDDAGVVIIKNKALITHASTAISTSSPYKPNPSLYWGGVVIAEGSDFIDNRRAAEFMRYKYPNISTFTNCTIKEENDWRKNTIGVTIWDCKGITFKGNTFENLDVSGIMGIDFDAIITDQNKFKHIVRYGIESYSTHPASGKTEITNGNEFERNYIDIYAQANAKNEGLVIRNGNTFKQSLGGVIMQGATDYHIKSNWFEDEVVGVLSEDTDSYLNKIECNTFNGTYQSINFQGDNSRTLFIANNFNSLKTDVNLTASKNSVGSIKQEQGTDKESVANCFTEGKDHINSVPGAADWFFYHASEEKKCYIPINNITDGGTNNYEIDKVGSIYHCVPSFAGEDPNGDDTRDIEETIIREDGRVRRAIGVSMGEDNLELARKLLESYATSTEDAQYFKRTQEINLARLQAIKDDVDYELSESDYAELMQIALAELPSSAYAKSLLAFLKEERFDVIFPTSSVSSGREVTNKPTTTPEKVSLSPNPSTGTIYLSLQNRPIKAGVFVLMDMLGRVVYQQAINAEDYANVTIEVNHLNDGMYQAKLTDTATGFVWNSKLSIKKP